jgi:hypothetical protein
MQDKQEFTQNELILFSKLNNLGNVKLIGAFNTINNTTERGFYQICQELVNEHFENQSTLSSFISVTLFGHSKVPKIFSDSVEQINNYRNCEEALYTLLKNLPDNGTGINSFKYKLLKSVCEDMLKANNDEEADALVAFAQHHLSEKLENLEKLKKDVKSYTGSLNSDSL